MRQLILLLALVVALPVAARAQNAVIKHGAGAPTGGCSFNQFYMNDTTGDLYDCYNKTWQLVATGAITISGSGTANKVSKWSGALVLTDSQITDTGALITLPGTVNLSGLTASRCLELDGSKNIVSAAAVCGSGSGANTALSNLASVSINTALLFQTGTDIGSTTKPARDFYMVGAGTFGTNYFKFTGTPTAARTITIPDASGTLPLGTGGVNTVPLWSGTNTLTDSVIQQGSDTVTISTLNSSYSGLALTGASSGEFNVLYDGSFGGVQLTQSGASGGGAIIMHGETSGDAIIGPAAVAGTPNRINLPTATGTNGQFLKTDGGNPQQLSWATVSGGSGCATTGSVGQLLTDDGAGGCTSNADFTISGSTLASGASGITDLSAASATAGFKLPAAAGAAPTTENVIAFDTTANTIAFGDGTNTNLVNTDRNTPAMPGSSGYLNYTSGAPGTLAANAQVGKRGLSFSIGDPAGSALTAAATTTVYATVPFACTISAYNLLIDAGTITVKFWKIATGTAIPTSANSINTSGVSIASGTAIHSTTLTDFTTTTVSANDIMAMNVTTTATAKFVNGVLQCDMN